MRPFSPLSQQEFPIEIVQGETFVLPVTYYDDDGDPIDLTDYTAVMAVKKTDSDRGTAIVELTTENGGIAITGSEGSVQCTIGAGETDDLEEQIAYYDLFVISPTGVQDRLLFGKAKITSSSQGDV